MSNYAPDQEQQIRDMAREVARDEVYRALSSPIDFPGELKAWIPQYVAIAGIQLPSSDVVGTYTTASTIAGLGAPVHGRPCAIRAGSSPYEFIQVTYDEVYEKWISSNIWHSFMTGLITVNVTSYTDLAATEFGVLYIPNFKDLYDAGLRPQIATAAAITCANSAYTVYFRSSLYQIASGDTAYGTQLATAGEVSHTGNTTETYKFSGWTTPTVTVPTKQHAYFIGQKNASTGSVSNLLGKLGLGLRWVADPA